MSSAICSNFAMCWECARSHASNREPRLRIVNDREGQSSR